MASAATEEHEAKGELVSVALVLDRPVSAANEEKLMRLVARLRDAGVAHVSVICEGAPAPANWQLGLTPVGKASIAPNATTQQFAAGAFGLSVLPEGSGQAIVAAAARLQAQSSTGPVSIEAFDEKIEQIAGPSPDLIIVTGGSPNLRGSLTWQAAYGEFIFTGRPWTELTGADLDKALKEFASRGRRFGGIA